MKKVVVLLLLACVCLPLSAANSRRSQDNSPKKHNLEIAYEFSDYGYREPHMEYPIHITAKKQGISLVYTRVSVSSEEVTEDDPSFATIELRYMDGKADYDGYFVDIYGNGTPAQMYDEKDYYMEAALKIGRYYTLSDAMKLWPYLGIGWRSLRNGEDGCVDLGGGVCGETYQRTSTYIYMPIGLKWETNFGSAVKLSLNGQFDWLLRGNQSSHTTMLANSTNFSNKQDKGYGVRASAKLETNFGKMGVFVEPFWRYWKIQNSAEEWIYDMSDPTEPSGYVIEPFNITREYGIRAGITF